MTISKFNTEIANKEASMTNFLSSSASGRIGNKKPACDSITGFRFKQALTLVLCGVMALCAFQKAAAISRKDSAIAIQKYLARIARGDAFNYILITAGDGKFTAVDGDTGRALRESKSAQDIIEWAMIMADVTILQEGQYNV